MLIQMREATAVSNEAFEEKLLGILPLLRMLASRHLCNPQDRADAVQECCYKALLHRDRLHCAESFCSWVTRILVNECYTILRHKQKYMLTADEALFCEQVDPCQDYAELREAISMLPEPARAALELNLKGYRYTEIAELLSVSESTIKSRVHRAKKAIMAEWAG